MRVRNAGVHCAAYPAVPVLALAAHHLAGMLCTLLCCVMLCCAALHGRAANQAFSTWLTLPTQHLPLPFLQKGDLGCRALYGAPRVQPLNDYRLIYFVKKCLDAYIVSCGWWSRCWADFSGIVRASYIVDKWLDAYIASWCCYSCYSCSGAAAAAAAATAAAAAAAAALVLAGWQFADCMAGPIPACSHAQFAMAAHILPCHRFTLPPVWPLTILQPHRPKNRGDGGMWRRCAPVLLSSDQVFQGVHPAGHGPVVVPVW